MNSLFLLSETFTNGYRTEALDIISLIAILSGIVSVLFLIVLFLIGLFLSRVSNLISLGLNFIVLNYNKCISFNWFSSLFYPMINGSLDKINKKENFGYYFHHKTASRFPRNSRIDVTFIKTVTNPSTRTIHIVLYDRFDNTSSKLRLLYPSYRTVHFTLNGQNIRGITSNTLRSNNIVTNLGWIELQGNLAKIGVKKPSTNILEAMSKHGWQVTTMLRPLEPVQGHHYMSNRNVYVYADRITAAGGDDPL